jgi:hypothetical protein
VDVEIARRMRFFYFRGIDFAQPVMRDDIGGDIVVQTLQGIAHIAVLLGAPVGFIEVFIHHLLGTGKKSLHAAQLRMLFTVEDVCLGDIGITVFDQHLFDKVLYFFDIGHAQSTAGYLENGNHLL